MSILDQKGTATQEKQLSAVDLYIYWVNMLCVMCFVHKLLYVFEDLHL